MYESAGLVPLSPFLHAAMFSSLFRAVEIGQKRSLGLSAYINTVLGRPRVPLHDSFCPTSPVDATNGERHLNGVLAAHVVSNHKHLLIDWVGHKAPTWIPDSGEVKHSYECTELKESKDDSPEFSRVIGPESYMLYVGDLRPFKCCEDCRTDRAHKDGWDYRLYVDASRVGNVSKFTFLFNLY